MKKIFVFIAALALVFMSCDSGDIIGGCYHGTFQNKSNGKLETGSLSFTYNRVIVGGDTLLYFMMNDVLPMSETGKCQFSGDVPPTLLSDVLKTIFREGYKYKKAGVIVMGIMPDSPVQQDLFDISAEKIIKLRRLDEAVDRMNRIIGYETVVIGAQQYAQSDTTKKAEVFANAIKHEFKSKNPTTRWSDIITLNKEKKR